MPRTEAKDKAIRKYQANMDRIAFRIKKEELDFIRSMANKRGMSLQGYIVKLLDEA